MKPDRFPTILHDEVHLDEQRAVPDGTPQNKVRFHCDVIESVLGEIFGGLSDHDTHLVNDALVVFRDLFELHPKAAGEPPINTEPW